MTNLLRSITCFLLLPFTSSLVTAHTQYGDDERPPIDYSTAEVDDAVARLVNKMAAGEASLKYESGSGHL